MTEASNLKIVGPDGVPAPSTDPQTPVSVEVRMAEDGSAVGLFFSREVSQVVVPPDAGVHLAYRLLGFSLRAMEKYGQPEPTTAGDDQD